MCKIKEEYLNIKDKYNDFDFEELAKKIKQQCSRKEYSKGGENTTYGIYQQEFFNVMRISNLRVGRKVKKKPLAGYHFIYYFDEKDELIMSEKVRNLFVTRNFFFRNGHEKDIVSIEYECDFTTIWYGKVFYNNDNKVIRYFDVEGMLIEYEVKTKTEMEICEKLFEYNDDVINVTYNAYTMGIKNNKIYDIYTEHWTVIGDKINLIDKKCVYLD